jgi:hypothetical protein
MRNIFLIFCGYCFPNESTLSGGASPPIFTISEKSGKLIPLKKITQNKKNKYLVAQSNKCFNHLLPPNSDI